MTRVPRAAAAAAVLPTPPLPELLRLLVQDRRTPVVATDDEVVQVRLSRPLAAGRG